MGPVLDMWLLLCLSFWAQEIPVPAVPFSCIYSKKPLQPFLPLSQPSVLRLSVILTVLENPDSKELNSGLLSLLQPNLA